MINTKLIVQMLESAEINSADLAIAKGKYEMPSNWKELKKCLKIRKDGK